MTVPALLDQLSARVGDVFAAAGYPAERGRMVISARPDLSQFQCNGAMACAKIAGKNPMEIAEALAEALRKDKIFKRVDVAKPGFLNISTTDRFMSEHIQAMADDAGYGGFQAKAPQTMMFDYCGPNIAKPMHVGH